MHADFMMIKHGRVYYGNITARGVEWMITLTGQARADFIEWLAEAYPDTLAKLDIRGESLVIIVGSYLFDIWQEYDEVAG